MVSEAAATFPEGGVCARGDVCPACGREGGEVVVSPGQEEIERFHAFSARKYGGLMDAWLADLDLVILHCRTCGHHWYRMQPDADRLARMYASGRSLKGVKEPSREPNAAIQSEMIRFARMVGRASVTPRLLDYGSGYGRWARAAARAGFEVFAYEPSLTRGREECAPFHLLHDLADLQGERFEAINLEQVLEHVSNPYATLRELRAFCVPSTLLRVSVPNLLRAPEGADLWRVWPFDGQDPHTMAPFEHLHGFTPDSLLALARRAGFLPLPGIRLARHYPSMWLRGVARGLAPRWGSTFLVLMPSARR